MYKLINNIMKWASLIGGTLGCLASLFGGFGSAGNIALPFSVLALLNGAWLYIEGPKK
ncbi:hypothetical protein [Ralstonia holmesii]|uniref:hypothetical protein n=1 Tax=Ralstonia holmesii TaxID=3058602 RepID=UPI003F18F6DA